MNELNVYNDSGNVITYLTQWDLNVNIYIECPEAYIKFNPYSIVSNSNSINGIVVGGNVTTIPNISGSVIKFSVPNTLLQYSLPITFDIKFNLDDNISNTDYIKYNKVTIPIQSFDMPLDYVYSNNINYSENLDFDVATTSETKTYLNIS